jgi:hypothetical protein
MNAINFGIIVYFVGVFIFFMCSPIWIPLLIKEKQNNFWCYIYSLFWPLIVHLCLTADHDS